MYDNSAQDYPELGNIKIDAITLSSLETKWNKAVRKWVTYIVTILMCIDSSEEISNG